MKIFLRDLIVGSLTASIMVGIVIWWNAPDYQTCVHTHNQTICYTVIK
jgi:hypothetical protein